jgi:putative ABC transport system substrate-binding protein
VSPKLSRIALLYNDQNTASVLAVQETQEWARTLPVAIEPVGVHDRASLEAAFAVLRRGRPDALMTTADAVLASYRTLIVEFARERRLISMYGDREYVVAGGLMFYGTSLTDMWRHDAIYVDRILKGAKPGDLPVEQPTKFALVINMKQQGRSGSRFRPR